MECKITQQRLRMCNCIYMKKDALMSSYRESFASWLGNQTRTVCYMLQQVTGQSLFSNLDDKLNSSTNTWAFCFSCVKPTITKRHTSGR